MFKKFHPIVISEIFSSSGTNSGKNFLKFGRKLKYFRLENQHFNKNIYAEAQYPPSMQFRKFKEYRFKRDEDDFIEDKWNDVVREGKLKEVKHFVNNYDNFDINIGVGCNWTALMEAAMRNQEEIVKYLLKFPEIDVTLQSTTGSTALSDAVYSENVDIFKWILNKQDIKDNNIKHVVNITNEDGLSIISYLKNSDDNIMLRMILDHPRLDVNVQDMRGKTVLIDIASSSKNDETVCRNLKLILKHPDIDINIQDEEGYTAIMKATDVGNLKILENLIMYGGQNIDLDLLNENNESALDIAKNKVLENPENKRFRKIVKVLEAATILKIIFP